MRIHALLFCLFSTSAFALYGGRPASSSSHLVNLQVGKDVFCQGVALSKTKILTAGHCIEEMGVRLNENSQILTYYPETVSVVFGRESVRAKEITFAPSMFDGGVLAEDIALVELKSPLNGVEVLPIAQHSDLVPGAMMLLTSGNEEATVKLRQKVQGYGSLVLVTDGSKSGICQGDSGGALLLVKNGRKYLAGILAARAEGCARRHSVAYFPRAKFNYKTLFRISFEEVSTSL